MGSAKRVTKGSYKKEAGDSSVYGYRRPYGSRFLAGGDILKQRAEECSEEESMRLVNIYDFMVVLPYLTKIVLK